MKRSAGFYRARDQRVMECSLAWDRAMLASAANEPGRVARPFVRVADFRQLPFRIDLNEWL